MKTFISRCLIMIAAFAISSQLSFGQKTNTKKLSDTKTSNMKTFVIEREVPGVGNFTPDQLRDLSKKSCSVLNDMGPSIKWLHSYVTGNKIYCVYQAESEELIRRHASLGGFPCNSVQEVATTISPATAN